jgi:GC-rich sequence DNA-binding factor
MPTLNSSEARIAQRLAQLRASKIEAETTLENATKDLVLLEDQERDLRKQVEEVEGKREWVEEFSGWAELLGTFLEEKYPKLEDIEKDSDQFMRERNVMVASRRSADDGDDLALFLGIPRPAEGADKSAVDTSTANSDYRRVRRTARTDRRERRIGVVNSASTASEEGLSTDSELEQDVVDDFAASQHDLERRVHALLEDVKAEDFRYPERGLALRFADWRKRYPEDYDGAFGGLALVQAWEFWARGEMVGWDPLRVSCRLSARN